MKNIRKKIISCLPAIPIAFVLASMFFSPSCANTTTPPSGGKKDTIPPLIVGLSPLPGTVNVPVHNTKIYITFNEYITVKDPKSIFLSPPLEKTPKYKMRGKTLIVYFESDLDTNTTYTLDLTNAVADNNEGNMFPGYTLVFSTGSQIDSMGITGTVMDCNTLKPVKGATVMLYRDMADSAIFKHRPAAAVKTDEWGFFSMRNIADADFRLFAITDESSNNIYDPESDRIAFIDSIIRPKTVVNDTLAEFLKYDMKDTFLCMSRKSEYELYLFKEKPVKQMIVNKQRTSRRSAYITFMAPDAKIDSLWIRGVKPKNLILQFNREKDSLELWVNDRRRIPDTLHVFVDYLKTDSTGQPSPFTEHLKLTEDKAKSMSKSSRRNIKHEDTTCVIQIDATPELIEQYGFRFEFKYPLIYELFDSLSLISVNPRQQEAKMNFKVEQDTLNLRKYILRPEGKFQTGYDYRLKVPHRKFRDINGYYNDSTEVKVSLPKDDALSSLTLNLENVNYTYIVDLLNEKRDNVLRSYNIGSATSLYFPYLKKGKYSIRFTEDRNGNGLVDTGSLLGRRQPEKVKFFKLKNGSYVLEIPEGTEIEQQINVAELFGE